ncbi:GrpB family protein [Candidatus Bathycorpusculum sp.]|uniref:GrpB family protein n=1 Tax=Candidatus Bathycorpusculum sp. TaxID=2994959 RepID=UPI002826D190|nr:GrpB family protein [Candidatus Termitimicrobium sp.]MCL2432319.1 GrpB family protein [Candidatus Termitimicrobium sp.]
MENRGKYMEKVTIGKRERLNGKIVLDEYNPLWPVLFEQEANRIRDALGNRAMQIHHVGSTAVPGLCAKPIIDILLVVADASDEVSYVSDLELLGYTLRIREPDCAKTSFKTHQHIAIQQTTTINTT